MKNTRKGWRAVAAVGIGLILALTGATAAQAYSGGAGAGSGGGGGGGGSWGAITRWNYVDTWSQLENAKYMVSNNGSADQYVRSSSGGQALLDICKGPNLVRIYYLGADGGIPIKPSSGTGVFPWTNPAGGDGPDQWAASQNGRGVYVICVADATERITKTETESRALENSETVTGAYSWSTAVNPEVVDSSGKDLIGVDNLNPQSTSKTTNFGKLFDSIATSGSGDFRGKLAQFRDAISKDAGESHSSLDLNESNKAGLAEGGVLSVSEFTRNATAVLKQSWRETRTRTATCDYVAGSNGTTLADPANCEYSPWSDFVEDSGSRNHAITKNMGTQANTGFWQIVSVHCNPDELTAALAAYGREGVDYSIVSQTVTDNAITTVLWTSKVSQRPTANGAKLFGVATSPVTDAALRRTGEVGFYDKECSTQCTTSSDGELGASTLNGGLINITSESNAPQEGALGGAKSGDTISNYFEMFRDNEQRTIIINGAYPQLSSGALDRHIQAPISTTVTLWHDGTLPANQTLNVAEGQAGYPSTGSTPDTSPAGGQLSVWAVADARGGGTATRTQLFTGTQSPTTQKNFSKADGAHPLDTYSGPYATQLAGSYRTFVVSGTWASLANRPVVLNVKWEYQPTTMTRFPSTVAFGADRAAVVPAIGYKQQKVDVRCYATFGTDTAVSGYDAKTQTGSGTPNLVDQNVLNAGQLVGGADDSARRTNTNLVIKFVRGVAE